MIYFPVIGSDRFRGKTFSKFKGIEFKSLNSHFSNPMCLYFKLALADLGSGEIRIYVYEEIF